MSNQDYLIYYTHGVVMADSTQYQTSTGYSSGSDTDDNDTPIAPTTTEESASALNADGIVKQQQMYIYSEQYEVSG